MCLQKSSSTEETMTKSEAEKTNQPQVTVFGRSGNIGRMLLTVEGQAQISEGLSVRSTAC